jgi:hypothetical protein
MHLHATPRTFSRSASAGKAAAAIATIAAPSVCAALPPSANAAWWWRECQRDAGLDLVWSRVVWSTGLAVRRLANAAFAQFVSAPQHRTLQHPRPVAAMPLTSSCAARAATSGDMQTLLCAAELVQVATRRGKVIWQITSCFAAETRAGPCEGSLSPSTIETERRQATLQAIRTPQQQQQPKAPHFGPSWRPWLCLMMERRYDGKAKASCPPAGRG